MLALCNEAKSAILAGFDDRCPKWMVDDFERGEVAMDEPPGFTERAYLLWLAAGGTVIAPKPVTMDDL